MIRFNTAYAPFLNHDHTSSGYKSRHAESGLSVSGSVSKSLLFQIAAKPHRLPLRPIFPHKCCSKFTKVLGKIGAPGAPCHYEHVKDSAAPAKKVAGIIARERISDPVFQPPTSEIRFENQFFLVVCFELSFMSVSLG